MIKSIHGLEWGIAFTLALLISRLLLAGEPDIAKATFLSKLAAINQNIMTSSGDFDQHKAKFVALFNEEASKPYLNLEEVKKLKIFFGLEQATSRPENIQDVINDLRAKLQSIESALGTVAISDLKLTLTKILKTIREKKLRDSLAIELGKIEKKFNNIEKVNIDPMTVYTSFSVATNLDQDAAIIREVDRQYKTSVSFDSSNSIRQIPALFQGYPWYIQRNPYAVNLCGWYSTYFASKLIEIPGKWIDSLNDRDLFDSYLESLKSAGNVVDGNISEEAIFKLLQANKDLKSNQVFILSTQLHRDNYVRMVKEIQFGGVSVITAVPISVDEEEHIKPKIIVDAFEEYKQLVFIIHIGIRPDSENKNSHWIAMHVAKENGKLVATIADSLGESRLKDPVVIKIFNWLEKLLATQEATKSAITEVKTALENLKTKLIALSKALSKITNPQTGST